jgi:hypothetical protein
MKFTRKTLIVGVTSATLLIGGGGIALASTAPIGGGSGPSSSTASLLTGVSTSVSPDAPKTGGGGITAFQQRVDARVAKLTTRLTTIQSKVDASTKLSPADKATLDADLTKTAADLATAKQDVDAATTRADLKAARPQLQTLRADVKQLIADAKSIRSSNNTSNTPSALGT